MQLSHAKSLVDDLARARKKNKREEKDNRIARGSGGDIIYRNFMYGTISETNTDATAVPTVVRYRGKDKKKTQGSMLEWFTDI